MDEVTLRTKLARALRLPDVPDEVWYDVVDREFVAEALNPELNDGFKELLNEVRRQCRFLPPKSSEKSRRKPPPSKMQPARPTSSLSPREIARALALSLYLARYAATTPRVRRFRADVLGGTLLSPEQGERLLASPAPRYLTQ